MSKNLLCSTLCQVPGLGKTAESFREPQTWRIWGNSLAVRKGRGWEKGQGLPVNCLFPFSFPRE